MIWGKNWVDQYVDGFLKSAEVDSTEGWIVLLSFGFKVLVFPCIEKTIIAELLDNSRCRRNRLLLKWGPLFDDAVCNMAKGLVGSPKINRFKDSYPPILALKQSRIYNSGQWKKEKNCWRNLLIWESFEESIHGGAQQIRNFYHCWFDQKIT